VVGGEGSREAPPLPLPIIQQFPLVITDFRESRKFEKASIFEGFPALQKRMLDEKKAL